jgi:enoyl-CoA hydratase
MGFTNIRVEKRPPLAVVTIDRPKVLNALNTETINELATAFDDLANDAATRVILLAGAGGRAFAAGADIRELASLTPGEAQELSQHGQRIFRRIETLGKPVIACVQGFALGGGCELAMACTLRIAAEDARLGQPEVKLGILPGYGGSQRLPRLAGRGAALKLLLTGAIVDAREALRIGLVDEVVSADQLMPRAEALALEICACAPLSLGAILRVVDEGLDQPLDAGLALESHAFGRLAGTADFAEGTRAFLEKRQPTWKNE